MSPEEAVAQRILQLPAVTAIVGTRVWLVMLPQSPVTPCVRVQQISQIDEGAHARGAGGVGWARVQVDAVTDVADGGNGYVTARTLTDAIHGDGRGDSATGLLGWRGTVGPLAITGIFSLLDAVADFTPDELTQIRMRRDYAVYFSE
jgi:hypothetical protein